MFAPEPPVGSPLLKLKNTVFSPHIAGVDTLSLAQMADQAAWIIVELYQGRWPTECVVNADVAPGWK